MVNYDVLIKFVRNSLGKTTTWPKIVREMWARLEEIKLGFPGINNNAMSLVRYSDIKDDDIFIYDKYIMGDLVEDEAPIMYRKLSSGKFYIEGIGCGADVTRDPDRLNLRWMDTVSHIPNLQEYSIVYRVNVRPTENGGPGYHYFFRAYRDNRL